MQDPIAYTDIYTVDRGPVRFYWQKKYAAKDAVVIDPVKLPREVRVFFGIEPGNRRAFVPLPFKDIPFEQLEWIGVLIPLNPKEYQKQSEYLGIVRERWPKRKKRSWVGELGEKGK